MWIKRALFTNFGPHRKLDLTFQQGLVGIFGFNGAGKSTVTDGIYAALTNDFSRFPGIKDDCINLLSEPDEESSIYLEGEHNGSRFELFRGLRVPKGTPRNSLIVDGGEAITNANNIESELEEKLGVNGRLIGTYVFVAQWTMFDFLDKTGGERAATYQVLCGTGKAEEICKGIERLLKADANLTFEVIDNSDELNTRIGERETEIDKMSEQLQTAMDRLMKPDKLEQAKTIKAKRVEWTRLSAEIQKLSASRQTLELNLSRATAAFDSKAALLSEAEELLQELVTHVEPARRVLDTAERHRKSSKARQDRLTSIEKHEGTIVRLIGQIEKLQAAKAAAQAQLSARKLPFLHPEDPDREQHVSERMTVQSKLDHLVEIDETIRDGGVIECPTCGTKTADMKHLTHLDGEMASLRQKLGELDGLIELIDGCRKAAATHKQWAEAQQAGIASTDRGIETAREQIDSAQAQIDTLRSVPDTEEPPPAESVADASQALKDHLAQVTLVDEARKLKQQAEINLVTARANAKNNLDQLGKAQKQLTANAVSDATFEKVEKALARHEEAKLKVAAAEARVQAARDSLEEAQKDLEELKAVIARNQKARKFVKNMQVIREEIMHRQCLPQVVATANLQDLEVEMNNVLQTFGGPFWVEATDDLLFNAHLPGMPPVSALRLSGGQKCVLAVAFRPAISALFDTDLGMMVLDEPTAGMDERNVGYLAEALAAYASRVRGNRQVILISHSLQLRPSFDQVIEIGVN